MDQSQPNNNNNQVRRSLKIIIFISILYLILVTVPISTLIILAVILGSSTILIKLKIAQIKKKGPNNFSPKMKELLYQKSIFDIYSDILYFPTISKIIGAFVKPAIAKPHPEQLKQSFENIPQKAKQIISTKGIINLFPQKIRAIGYKQQQPLPIVRKDWTWYNAQRYKLHQQVHQDTLGKRMLQKIDNKIDWKTLAFLIFVVGYGIKTMNPKRARKMFIQNGCFAGLILVIMIGLIKLTNKKKRKIIFLENRDRIEIAH